MSQVDETDRPRPFTSETGAGRLDADGNEWFACDPYPCWYRWDGGRIVQPGPEVEWPDGLDGRLRAPRGEDGPSTDVHETGRRPGRPREHSPNRVKAFTELLDRLEPVDLDALCATRENPT